MSRVDIRQFARFITPLLFTIGACTAHPATTPVADASGVAGSDESASKRPPPGEPPEEPPPPPSGPWAPSAPVAPEPGAIAWAKVGLQSACAEPEPSGGNAAPVRVITTEAAFEVAYCRPSSVDWTRFRLAVIPYSDILVDITVVPDEPQVRVLLQTRPSCEAPWGDHLHLLLPAGNGHVVVVRKMGPPDDCADGYGY